MVKFSLSITIINLSLLPLVYFHHSLDHDTFIKPYIEILVCNFMLSCQRSPNMNELVIILLINSILIVDINLYKLFSSSIDYLLDLYLLSLIKPYNRDREPNQNYTKNEATKY